MYVPAPLLRLPPEITERTTAFLRVEYSNSDAEEETSVVTDSATAMSTWGKSMYDFRAIRLTCKDIYLKTFRLFGRRYFSTVSMRSTRVSLDRLRDLANYKNSFGLTLLEFPSHLCVSTHRLLPESEINRLLSLSEDDDLEPLSDTRTIVATISLAYKLDLENCNVPGAYIPEPQVIAGQYRKAAGDQQLLTSSNHDVTTIARSIAAFPRFCSISLDSSDKSWGKEDWEAFVGFEKRAFTTLGDTDSGQSNMSFTLNRVLQAIAQAEALCKAAGRRLNLRSLEATWSEVDDEWSPHSHQNVRLQSLDIHPSSRADLRSVLSRLTSLHVDINGFSEPENLENDGGKIQEALQILLSSSKLRDLQINFVDDGETMEDDMISMTRPDETWIGDSILAMVVAVERSHCLRALTLNCNEMIVSQATVEKLIQKHTATLETIDVQAEMPDPATALVSISDLRERFKSLLRIIAGCHSIARLVLNMDNEDCVVLYVNEWRSEHIMERIQSMIMRPTGPEHDFFWANWDEYSESGDGDDDDEDGDG